ELSGSKIRLWPPQWLVGPLCRVWTVLPLGAWQQRSAWPWSNTIDDEAVCGAAAFALLERPSCHLLSRQLQDRLDRGASGNIDQLVAGPLALLDQIDHRQQHLAILGENLGRRLHYPTTARTRIPNLA